MFKFDLRTLVMFAIIVVVGWTQYKIYTQDKTISQLNTDLSKSQQKVSNLTEELEGLKKQVLIDRKVVEDWFTKTNALTKEQQTHREEVKDVLNKFKFDMAVNAEKPEAVPMGASISPRVVDAAIKGMWNSFTTTRTGVQYPGVIPLRPQEGSGSGTAP